MILYLASGRHHVPTVTRAARIASVSGVRSMVLDDRGPPTLLLEVESEMRRLDGAGPPDAPVERATNVDHDPLRRWGGDPSLPRGRRKPSTVPAGRAPRVGRARLEV